MHGEIKFSKPNGTMVHTKKGTKTKNESEGVVGVFFWLKKNAEEGGRKQRHYELQFFQKINK